MKVVIDTNVLVSAALKDKDPEAVILAEFFVTGDRDFAQAQKLLNTTILSVSLFKKLVMSSE